MLVHGPQTGLWWTESTRRLPGVVQVLRVHAQVADEGGVFPCFSRGGAPADGELAASPYDGAGVRLGRGIVPSHRSDCDDGVKVAAKASQGAGHGERRLKLHRRAGMARCCGIGRFCGARGRHNAPTGMLGMSRGPPGPQVALATAAAS